MIRKGELLVSIISLEDDMMLVLEELDKLDKRLKKLEKPAKKGKKWVIQVHKNYGGWLSNRVATTMRLG